MSKNKILILFSHPLFEKSHANKALVDNIPISENITFHDLYEEYPDFDIDVSESSSCWVNMILLFGIIPCIGTVVLR